MLHREIWKVIALRDQFLCTFSTCTVLSYLPQLHNYCTSWTAIARLVYVITKCQFLARPDIVTDLFHSEWLHKISIWEGHPALYHTILLYFILSLATVANSVYFAWICFPLYSVPSYFFCDKINTSLYLLHTWQNSTFLSMSWWRKSN